VEPKVLLLDQPFAWLGQPKRMANLGAVDGNRLLVECDRLQGGGRDTHDLHGVGKGLGRETARPWCPPGDLRDAPVLKPSEAIDADVVSARIAPAKRGKEESLSAEVYGRQRRLRLATSGELCPDDRPRLCVTDDEAGRVAEPRVLSVDEDGRGRR